jgi:CubicO group peptidase (beta-lactamase class C family)
MCKLGQLFLQNGKWHKKQIVSAKWVRAATQDHTKQHYGYQWWTDLPVPGYSSYSASGLKGQYVRVIPKLRMVIAMTARLEISANNKTIDQLIREFIIPAARRRSALPANPKGSRKLLAAISRSRQIKRKSSGLTADDSPRIPPPKPRKPGK